MKVLGADDYERLVAALIRREAAKIAKAYSLEFDDCCQAAHLWRLEKNRIGVTGNEKLARLLTGATRQTFAARRAIQHGLESWAYAEMRSRYGRHWRKIVRPED